MQPWPVLVREYLALRQEELLSQAIQSARAQEEREITSLLETFQRGDWEAVPALAERVVSALHATGRQEEALTVALLRTDGKARLVELFSRFPSEQRNWALQTGLKACAEAIQISQILQDEPCQAFFLEIGRASCRERV